MDDPPELTSYSQSQVGAAIVSQAASPVSPPPPRPSLKRRSAKPRGSISHDQIGSPRQADDSLQDRITTPGGNDLTPRLDTSLGIDKEVAHVENAESKNLTDASIQSSAYHGDAPDVAPAPAPMRAGSITISPEKLFTAATTAAPPKAHSPRHRSDVYDTKALKCKEGDLHDNDSKKPTDKDTWKHGIIEFENTNWRTKYLIVPEKCVCGEELLAVVTWLWGLSLPKLVVELQGAEAHYKQFSHDLLSWRKSDQEEIKERWQQEQEEEAKREAKAKSQAKRKKKLEDWQKSDQEQHLSTIGKRAAGVEDYGPGHYMYVRPVDPDVFHERRRNSTDVFTADAHEKEVLRSETSMGKALKEMKGSSYSSLEQIECRAQAQTKRAAKKIKRHKPLSDHEVPGALHSQVLSVAQGIINASAECGGWLINNGQGRSAIALEPEGCQTDYWEGEFYVQGKTILLADAMKEFHRKNVSGVVSFVYTCKDSVFGFEDIEDCSVDLAKTATKKVIYPHVDWFKKGKFDEKFKIGKARPKDLLDKEISPDDPITPANSLAAFCATHVLIYRSFDQRRTNELLQEGLDRLGVCKAPVYMHGDYKLYYRIMKETSPVVIMLKGTGGATDVCAEGLEKLKERKEARNKLYEEIQEEAVFAERKMMSARRKMREKKLQDDERKLDQLSGPVNLEIPVQLPSRRQNEARTPGAAFSEREGMEDGKGEGLWVLFTEEQENIKICEIVNNRTEHIIDMLLLFLNKVQDEQDEKVGEKGNDNNRIQQAGIAHAIFAYNSQFYLRWCNVIEILSAVIAALTTVVSVILAYLTRDEPVDKWGGGSGGDTGIVSLLAWSSTILPILAGFLLAVQHSFTPRTKWAQLKHAQNRIESAIWKYRARAGEYKVRRAHMDAHHLHKGPHGKVVQKALRPEATLDQSMEEKEEKNQIGTTRMPRTRREIFEETLKDVQTAVRTSELRTCALDLPLKAQAAQNKGYLDTLTRARRFFNQSRPEGFFRSQEHLGPSWKSKLLAWFMGSNGDVPSVSENGGSVSAEEYIKERLVKRREYFLQLAPKLSKWLFCMRMFLIVTTSVNAVLGLMPLKQWIAAVVAVSTAIEVILKDQMVDQRIRSTNAAILRLENLLTWWTSLTMVERRYAENYEQLVLGCESVAYADMVWLPNEEKSGDPKVTLQQSDAGNQTQPSKQSTGSARVV